ncbi:unnamed protein product [Anisakis simplex]|uniref:Protein kinase C-like 3 (inferred by orthology to a C. elegans protein) n=1 Tax=Anisakis simplex TaxID=6269 RepID=A0A0M3JKW3_ANISI|nr:unnamed protein product [Anisakis simplex]
MVCDPCTISSQRELDEAVRLLQLNGEAELNIHVFLGIPSLPGLPCTGEDSELAIHLFNCTNP